MSMQTSIRYFPSMQTSTPIMNKNIIAMKEWISGSASIDRWVYDRYISRVEPMKASCTFMSVQKCFSSYCFMKIRAISLVITMADVIRTTCNSILHIDVNISRLKKLPLSMTANLTATKNTTRQRSANLMSCFKWNISQPYLVYRYIKSSFRPMRAKSSQLQRRHQNMKPRMIQGNILSFRLRVQLIWIQLKQKCSAMKGRAVLAQNMVAMRQPSSSELKKKVESIRRQQQVLSASISKTTRDKIIQQALFDEVQRYRLSLTMVFSENRTLECFMNFFQARELKNLTMRQYRVQEKRIVMRVFSILKWEESICLGMKRAAVVIQTEINTMKTRQMMKPTTKLF